MAKKKMGRREGGTEDTSRQLYRGNSLIREGKGLDNAITRWDLGNRKIAVLHQAT